ncbi:sugar ABC transporter substrate-binding protein [Leucobacter sp. USHLN153]|uniref:sugar ABC transporter substrate-binding protein n=1 Tax=Leucobacter sp. USHLN153 TaxID=3081268 RepID=UPI00301994E1
MAACSSGGSDAKGAGNGTTAEGEGVAKAQELVEKAIALPEFGLADAPKIDLSAAAGKRISIIPLSSENPYVMDILKSAKAVAEDHDVTVNVFENQGQPNQWAQGIDQAVDNGDDAVVLLGGADPKLVVPQLTRAKEAGLKIIVGHLYQSGDKPPAEVADLIDGYTTAPFTQAAELLADYAVAKSGESSRILYLTSDEVAPAVSQKEAFQAEVKDLCDDCTVDVVNVPVTDWASKLATETQSYLVANPDTDWVIPIYDSMVPPTISGINQAGKAAEVKVASFNGTPSILKLIQDGTPLAADIGESVDWLGYSVMDSVFRVFDTGEGLPGGDDKMPLRIFDESNIDEAGTPPVATDGYGDAYVEGYAKLWTE